MAEEHILELSLLENGLDFIIRGIDELYELYDDIEYQQYIDPISQPQKDYKYGILHLFSGFLLLLKERLTHHMPDLIFEGRIEEIRNKLKNGKEPNTVNLDEALNRLEIGPKVTFSEADTKIIRKIQGYRNRFEHYKFSANKFEISKTIIDFIDLIDRFLIDELKIDITSTSLTTDPEIRVKVVSIESVYRRMTEKRKRELLAIGAEKLRKFKRNRENVLQELDTASYIAYKEEGGIDVTMECPECGEDTLIIYGDFTGVCSNKECSSYFLIKHCDRCGKVTIGYEWEEKWCDDCNDEIQRMVDRDD
jgi:molecular chaperone GrpE (heat shock protein)